ncbi:MAG: hypothetical protein WED00_18790 [Aquisalimonadaceae bacterium]
MGSMRHLLFVALLLIAFGSLGLVGCEVQGPAEEAGEKIDDTVDDAEDRFEND